MLLSAILHGNIADYITASQYKMQIYNIFCFISNLALLIWFTLGFFSYMTITRNKKLRHAQSMTQSNKKIELHVKDVLFFDCSYTWKLLALDSLEQGTTTGRDIRYLVSKTELVYASYRVTAANQRESSVSCCLGDSLSDSL